MNIIALSALGDASYGIRIGCILVASLLAAMYLRLLRDATQHSFLRLLASLPVLAFCVVTPTALRFPEEVVSRAVVAFSLTWVLSFKALAMAINRGALADPRLTTLQFCAFAVLPLSPGGPAAKNAAFTRSSSQLLFRFYAKVG